MDLCAEDILGMKFECEDDVYAYGRCHGFGIRKD